MPHQVISFKASSKFMLLFALCFLGFVLLADNAKNEALLNQKVQHYLKNQSVRFLENKGQMTDMDGKPAPFVLFKAEANGVNLYITEKGLTYVLFKMEEDEEEERENEKRNKKGVPKSHEENIQVEWNRIDMALKGANIKKENVITEGKSAYFKQYFLAHCPDGIKDVHEYEKITIKNIYPNIDWVLYNSSNKGFKYDFVVHPGANPKDIEMVYTSKRPIEINEQGELEIKSKRGNITEHTPISFLNGEELKTQYTQTQRKRIKLNGENGYETSIMFDFPNTDIVNLTSDLIIDPQLVWGTFFGGNEAEGCMEVTTDTNGNLFSVGYVLASGSFPTQTSGSFFQGIFGGNGDAFILKFNNVGVLIWATYYGGGGSDAGYGINIDINNNILVTGFTTSTDFPTQNNGAFFQISNSGNNDVFILKFDNNGNRMWATYYGGSNIDEGFSITSDIAGNIFITGATFSSDLPTQNAGTFYQASNGGGGGFDMFILKFGNTGNRLWATYYGGSYFDYGFCIDIDLFGNVLIVGETASPDFPTQNSGTFFQATNGGGVDAVILKFDNVGNRIWATYYGGNGTGSNGDSANSIASDVLGNIFVIGTTNSSNFPIQNSGAFFQGIYGGAGFADYGDIFILKFDNNGNRLWATYFGGSDDDGGNSVYKTFRNLVIDQCGNLFISFFTASNDLITQPHCSGGFYDNSSAGSLNARDDQFIASFSNTGNLLWGTYFGGDGEDIRSTLTMDNNNNLFFSGEWNDNGLGTSTASSYPLVNYGGGSYFDGIKNGSDDLFFAKFPPSVPVFSPSQTNPTSCSCNGVATISLSSVCSNLNYYWSNGTTILNTTASTSSISGLCAGVHQVTITSACSFTQTVTFTLTPVGASITTSITVTNASCTAPTGTITLNSVTGGVPNYTITEGAISIATNVNVPYVINGVSLGLHTYSLTDANGCSTTFTANISSSAFSVTASTSPSSILTCSTNTLQLSTLGGVTYTWSGSGIVSGATTASVTINSPGIYTVSATDASSCVATTTIAVTQNTVTPIISISNTGTLTCTTTTLSLTGTGGSSYNWSGSGIISGATTANPIVNLPGVYTLTVTGTNGCIATASTSVIQNTIAPIATASNTGTLTCTTTTLSLTGTGGGTYSWSGPGIVSGGTTTNPTINQGGVYTLTVTGINGCKAVASTTVIQNPSTVIATASSNGTLSCITPTVSLTGTGGGTYNWSGPGIVSGETTAIPIVNQAGIYTLTVTDANGCSATSTTTVSQSPLTTTVTVSPDVTITTGSQTQLTVTGSASNYTWSPSLGLSCTTCTNPIASPVVTTTYCVLSSLGTCTAQACTIVTLKENCDGNKGYGVPNAFSPNGDGKNDEFCLQGWSGCVIGFSIKIYDRWGEKVYEATDENFCWDGTYQGKLLNPAVFVFYIEANIVNLGGVTKKGNITLIK